MIKGPMPSLAVVTRPPFDGELSFTPNQESGLQSILVAASWSGRRDDPIVVPGLVGLAMIVISAGLGGECLPDIQETRSEHGSVPLMVISGTSRTETPPPFSSKAWLLALGQLEMIEGAGNP